MRKRLITAIIALSLALCCLVGVTVAWLSVETPSVTNTFTYGDINITLTETTGEKYQMIPGNTLPKDPTVTVKADSEACWLFIKVEKTNNPDTYLEYTIDSGWTKLSGFDDVYYREVDNVSSDTPYAVLTNNQVVVKDEITKTQMTAIGTAYPTLTFTAYAVQKANISSVTDAWSVATTGSLPTT